MHSPCGVGEHRRVVVAGLLLGEKGRQRRDERDEEQVPAQHGPTAGRPCQHAERQQEQDHGQRIEQAADGERMERVARAHRDLPQQEQAEDAEPRADVPPSWKRVDVQQEERHQKAPEHLEVMTRNPRKLAEGLHNAGALFLGPWSSEPVGDYIAGPNHTLPTNGTARFSSPLGVYDYLKRTTVIEYSAEAMAKNGRHVVELAEAEGFFHHAEAVRKRL